MCRKCTLPIHGKLQSACLSCSSEVVCQSHTPVQLLLCHCCVYVETCVSQGQKAVGELQAAQSFQCHYVIKATWNMCTTTMARMTTTCCRHVIFKLCHTCFSDLAPLTCCIVWHTVLSVCLGCGCHRALVG